MTEIFDREGKDQLTFDPNKQIALLGHLLNNEQFFVQCHDRLKPEWFTNPTVNKIYAAKVKWFNDYHRSPTIEELRDLPDFRADTVAFRGKVNDILNLSKELMKTYGLDALRPELTEWMHSYYFETGVRQAYMDYKSKKLDKAFSALSQCNENIKNTVFEADTEESFSNFAQEVAKTQAEYSDACTTGDELFDRLLTPKALKGSLLPGDMSIILAPTNTGKTTAMISTVVANIKQNKNVLFITHEGRPSDIKEKLICCFTGWTAKELLDSYKDPATRQYFEEALIWFKRYLTYVPMNEPGLPVENVAAMIRRKQEERISKKGKGFALLVDDYPAKITTQQAAKGMSKRERDEIVYNYFEQIGLQYKMHVLCAIQTNREGSRVNKGQREDRLLTLEDVQESWGPMTCATNVWTINRSPHDKVNNRLIYYIDKSRSSETGFAIVCKTDFSRSRTHGFGMGSSYYRSASTYAGKLDTLLDQYQGSEIPESLLLAS